MKISRSGLLGITCLAVLPCIWLAGGRALVRTVLAERAAITRRAQPRQTDQRQKVTPPLNPRVRRVRNLAC